MPRLIFSLVLLSAAGLASLCPGAEPPITIVFGLERASDQRPAHELSAMLKKLTGGEVTIASEVPRGDGPVILLGNPQTTPSIAEALAGKWPDLSEQGHLIKSAKLGNRDVLVVGGSNQQTILWAAYELGHQHGVRYLMQSDVYPSEPVALKLTGFDIVLEPARKDRPFVLGSWPLGTATWGLADHERLLIQLTKLKFNLFDFHQPVFAEQTERQTEGWKIDGNTAGRAAFRGATRFGNPDLMKLKPDEQVDNAYREQIHNAYHELMTSISRRAYELGLRGTNVFPTPLEPAKRWRLLHTFSSGGFPLLTDGNQPETHGVAIDFSPFGDLNPAVYYLSRAGFDATLTPEKAYHELFTTVCGKDDVADRLLLGFQAIDQATVLLNEVDPRFGTLEPDMLVKQFTAAEAPPEWFAKLKELYTQSMIEMFRSRDNCRPDTKPLLYYHCKRGEFAVEYLNAVEAVQQAGAAKKAGDGEKAIELLEKSVESLYNGINSLSEVARDQSDRALIAVLNEYAYRPLVRQLERELDAAE